ncbi:MAG: polyprenyl synthetase family protein, partial [Bacillota bacterium]|nr:polyprenyl synthetase family protein [Bacillota bacterium]
MYANRIYTMTEQPAENGAPQGPRTLQASLDETRELIRRTLQQSDPVLADVTRHLAQGNGKNIRAAFLLAASADENGLVSQNAVTAAAALEILHLATLVHDDIIDDAPTRRGQPSVQRKFGKKTAVISGDYLFCVCFSMIAGQTQQYPQHISLFTKAISGLCVGELRQHQHNRDTDLSVLGYMRIIAGKTAALFALALYAGSLLGGSDEKTCRLMGRIGYNVGILFQLIDDCLDYESTAGTLQKSVKHDLTEGVITLPLIYAMQKNIGLKQLAGQANLSAAEIRDAAAEVMRLGGLNQARLVADKYYLKAGHLLEQL